MIRELAEIVGIDHVRDSRDARDYDRCTLDRGGEVSAVVRPDSREEVQAIVRLATERKVPLYPISRGRNWGYGSCRPAGERAVVVDLGRMSRIEDYDAELGYVRVQPGVTQGQLVDFLAAEGGRHWPDTTSVTPEASVLGNALERGHGLTPYADHVEQLEGVEAVLGDGSVFESGFARFGGKPSPIVDRWAAGPSLTGLFSQSSFGIVTAGTVALMPAPACARGVIVDFESDEEFFEALPALRSLRLQRTIDSGPRCANVYRGLMFEPYPWDEVAPGGVLPKDKALALARASGRGAWRVSFAVYGHDDEVAGRLLRVREALEGKTAREPVVFDPCDTSTGPYRVLGSLLSGQLLPDGAASVRTYWRKRTRPASDLDPNRDGCGVIWLAPVTPFRASDVAVVQKLVEEVLPRHGFEPDISMYGLRPRALHFHISIIYDREIEGADAAALRAHDELLTRCMEAGYPPHRLGVQSMHAMHRVDPVHARLLRGIKRLVDPAGVVAPGRYAPPPACEDQP